MISTEQKIQFDFAATANRLQQVVKKTPLQYNQILSDRYDCHVRLKREDLQRVRSYKIRGAYNLMSSLSKGQLSNGVVCASAGNHAQGFAFSCKAMQVNGVIFMPVITPRQKISQTRMFGKEFIEIKLVGDNFDACSEAAKQFTEENKMTFIPPFDHPKIIEGQGTIGLEILEELNDPDFVFLPVGGGGLSAGVGTCIKNLRPQVKIIGVEPEGAPSMSEAIRIGQPIALPEIDRFIDGAAVKKVGNITFAICKDLLDDVVLAPEGKVCSTILQLYNEEAIVVEPAGALSIAALEQYRDVITGKNVVCVISGSNNDIDRMPEIKERSLVYEGLKHYFLIRFVQRPGALKEFVNNVLGPADDITRFEYIKKTKKESGPALVGIEVQQPQDIDVLKRKMKIYQVDFMEIGRDDKLFGYLV